MRLSRSRKYQEPVLLALALVSAATLGGLPFQGVIEPTNKVMLYLLAVVVAGVTSGHRAAVLTSLLGVLSFDLFFIPPYYRLDVADAQYLITFAVLTAVGLLISALAAGWRRSAALALERAEFSRMAAEFSEGLHGFQNLEELCQHLESQFSHWLGTPACVERVASLPDGAIALSSHHCLALSKNFWERLDGEKRTFLETLLHQARSHLERVQQLEESRRWQWLAEREKLQSDVLNSVSHELRTPLVSILGALTSLREQHKLLTEENRWELLDSALSESQRLNQTVGKILDMSRIQSGNFQLDIQPCDLEDLVAVALEQTQSHGRVEIAWPADGLPLVELDYVLILQVLTNLIDNGLRYSPTLLLELKILHDQLQISVEDCGPGVPAEHLERMFEKFVRVADGTSPGLGLGLSICKGFVEAHGGTIRAQCVPAGGLRVDFSLPLQRKEPCIAA